MTSSDRPVRSFLLLVVLALHVAAVGVPPAGAAASAGTGPSTESLTFIPEADAYVDAGQPSGSFGTSNYLWVDSSSVKQSFLRFRLSGVSGRTVTEVHLRIYQTDASPVGGSVWSMSSNEWDESVTWDTRPAIDGPFHGAFGAVEALRWYELTLDPALVAGDGPVSLAIDSVDSDGARWGSREHASKPELIVELEPVESDSFTFTPETDAHVDAAQPETSFGTSSSLWVDASPVKQAFLRFDVVGISGRFVTGVRLRLHQRDAAPEGGRVFAMSSDEWDETITWNSRPAIDGAYIGGFGAVGAGGWYEAELVPSAVSGEGSVSLAIDSTNADGARWASREHVQVPQLIVDVATIPGQILGGLSEVAAPGLGSSDPTYYASNHRLDVTANGRQLAVHGRHSQGVQLAWRDPGGGWMMKSRGDTENGLLLAGSGTGDWTASIAVAEDSTGEEHAWVVWSGATAQSSASVQLRRLSELDSADGPVIGPAVTVSSSGLGNSKVDLAFETAPNGSLRGCISWLKRTGSSAWNETILWFTDLDQDAPAFHGSKVLFGATSGGRASTLIAVPTGMRVVVRNPSGRLQTFAHDATSPLTTWAAGARGVSVGGASIPGGDSLASGQVLAAIESDRNGDVVTVQRFSADGGTATIDLQLTGYRDPTVVTDGTNAWLVMIRQTDGFVVSRSFTPGGGWDAADRLEIGAEGGGNHSWPNVLRQSDGRFRLLVRGPAGGISENAVLALDRPL